MEYGGRGKLTVVFATPEEAAADFVSQVLIAEGDPVLGPFQQGDARSGEIAVMFAGETGELDPPREAGVLLMRQIGPTDGWYVIGATSAGAVIDSPSALQEVPAGTVTVSTVFSRSGPPPGSGVEKNPV